MESVSSPIDLWKIPTAGCKSPCRQQLSAAVSSTLVWIHSLKSINPMMRLAKLGNRATSWQPSRFIRLFVDLEPRLGTLLNRMQANEEGLAYVGEILTALEESSAKPSMIGETSPFNSEQPIVEPLSQRERQILKLLADRLTDKEIGHELHISTVTVKRHAANIYQKLGVHGRRQAVAKAHGLGILSQLA